MTSEFQNRDYRMTSTVKKPFYRYWGYGSATSGGGADYTTDIYAITDASKVSGFTYGYTTILSGGTGYSGRKFTSENKGREDYKESADYLQIRLAEMYLTYAEATCELNGGDISDDDLNYSLNKVRARAGVAPLTHALIAPYPGLTLLGEIRRERALELFAEGHRLTDLMRWGIAETELRFPTAGAYVQYGGVDTEYKTAICPSSTATKTVKIFNASSYPAGYISTEEVSQSSYAGVPTLKAGAVITERAVNRNFSLKYYLHPLPSDQITLNPNLKQNPEW